MAALVFVMTARASLVDQAMCGVMYKADEWVALARRFAIYNIDGDGSQFAALERVGHVIFV